MGGLGSGNWWGTKSRKRTVEESLVVAAKHFRRPQNGAVGTLTWTWKSGGQSSVRYLVLRVGERLMVTLDYRWRDQENVLIPIQMQETPTQFGGRRWWFTCPLVVNGAPCCRRVGKLYLPPGARYFGCRTCHNLTYRSSQEAHQDERLLNRLGIALGEDAHMRRLLLTRLRGEG